jgi:hypothetical protein
LGQMASGRRAGRWREALLILIIQLLYRPTFQI